MSWEVRTLRVTPCWYVTQKNHLCPRETYTHIITGTVVSLTRLAVFAERCPCQECQSEALRDALTLQRSKIYSTLCSCWELNDLIPYALHQKVGRNTLGSEERHRFYSKLWRNVAIPLLANVPARAWVDSSEGRRLRSNWISFCSCFIYLFSVLSWSNCTRLLWRRHQSQPETFCLC